MPLAEIAASRIRVKILMVDDSPDNLVSLEAALDGLGQELVQAQLWYGSVASFAGRRFRCHLAGREDARNGRVPNGGTDPFAEALPSYAHSLSHRLQERRHLFRGYDLGAVDFLFKPIVPEVLRSKVGVFVELSRNTALLRRQAEVSGKAEQKFRSLLEAAPDAMIISYEDGRISLMNSQAEILFSFPSRRADRGKTSGCWCRIGVVIPKPAQANSPAWLAPPTELWARRKNGHQFPVELSLSPLQTPEGLLLTSAIRDVTERLARR